MSTGTNESISAEEEKEENVVISWGTNPLAQ